MTNFALQLKAEITRLAKKESKATAANLKKAATQARSEIAALKRRVGALEMMIKKLSKASKESNEVQSEHGKVAYRFRSSGFASLRKRLGLSGAEMAKILGVSAQSVYHWETGMTRPRANQLASIAELRKLGKKQVAAKLA